MASEIEFYFYANCTSCKKADAFLRSENIQSRRRDIFKHKLSAVEIHDLLRRANLSVADVLSTRSRPYQELGLAQQTLTDDQLIDLMSEYPALLRRPLLLSPVGVLIGFNSGAYESLAKQLS